MYSNPGMNFTILQKTVERCPKSEVQSASLRHFIWKLQKQLTFELPYIFYTRIDQGIGPTRMTSFASGWKCNGMKWWVTHCGAPWWPTGAPLWFHLMVTHFWGTFQQSFVILWNSSWDYYYTWYYLYLSLLHYICRYKCHNNKLVESGVYFIISDLFIHRITIHIFTTRSWWFKNAQGS